MTDDPSRFQPMSVNAIRRRAGLEPLRTCDLVCEGGGVKGLGLVGAIEALSHAGYSFGRFAGTSAGAIVAALAAAVQKHGEPMSTLTDLMKSIDYSKIPDPRWYARSRFGWPLAVVLHQGFWKGDALHDLFAGMLGDLGVHTFGDLRVANPPGPATQQQYSLVACASDLSRQRLVRIPWDLPSYNIDPDTFPVATAIRASASIEFAFEPVKVDGCTWVDGGMLSDYPIELFDASPVGNRPVYGIRLSSQPDQLPRTSITNTFSLAWGLIDTLKADQENAYIDDPGVVARTIFVPTDGISVIDFGISAAQQQQLYQAGLTAGQVFVTKLAAS